jgi:hypothetical protein
MGSTLVYIELPVNRVPSGLSVDGIPCWDSIFPVRIEADTAAIGTMFFGNEGLENRLDMEMGQGGTAGEQFGFEHFGLVSNARSSVSISSPGFKPEGR